MVVFLHAYNLGFAPETAANVPLKTTQWIVQDYISYGLTRIAVPIFFLFSGFWFFYRATGTSNEFVHKIRKRISTLLIPFLFWSLFGIAFYFAMQSLPQFEKFFSKELVKNYTAEMWFSRIFVNPIPYQLWFIRDLMVLVLLSPILYFGLKYLGRILLILFFILWFYRINLYHNSIEALLFFSTGGFIALFRTDLLLKAVSTKQTNILILIWVLLLIIKTAIGWYCVNVFLFQSILNLAILVGVLAFWLGYDAYLSKHENFKLVVLNLSMTTFFIFASHEPILTIVKKILFIVFGTTEVAAIIVYFLAPLVTITLVYFIAMGLKKYATSFYQTVTGGR